MARVLAVFALHAGALEEELAAESAEHDGVELLLDKLVPVLLVDRVLALANGALTTETAGVVRSLADVRFDCVDGAESASHGMASLENEIEGRDVPKFRCS